MLQSSLELKNVVAQYVNNKNNHDFFVDNVNLTIYPNKIMGIVGESGSGKTTLSKIIAGIAAPKVKKIKGKAKYLNKETDVRDIAKLPLRTAMLFQDPFNSLNPSLKIGKQLKCVLKCKNKLFQKTAVQLLAEVGIEHPADVMRKYPSELSGGINQRICIAMLLFTNPDLLILDEPTSAVDEGNIQRLVTLIKTLHVKRKLSIIIVSHNMEFVKEVSDKIIVMQSGKIVETVIKNDTNEWSFMHDYSISLDRATAICMDVGYNDSKKVVTSLTNISKAFGARQIISNFSLEIMEGEIVGIIGDSGCGKSTLAKMLFGLYKPNSGKIFIDGESHIEMVFQNAYSSLNPKMSVRKIFFEHFLINHLPLPTDDYLQEYIQFFPLPRDILNRRVDQLSGGQRQMVAIIRAIVSKPNLIIFDEPTSALDVLTQKKLMELLLMIKKTYSFTYIIISHDKALLKGIANRLVEL